VVKVTKISEKFAPSSFTVKAENSTRMSAISTVQQSATFRRFYSKCENNSTAWSLVVDKKPYESQG
jgi:hypothetical protein